MGFPHLEIRITTPLLGFPPRRVDKSNLSIAYTPLRSLWVQSSTVGISPTRKLLARFCCWDFPTRINNSVDGFPYSEVPDCHFAAGIFPLRVDVSNLLLGDTPTSGPFQFAGSWEPMIAWFIRYIPWGFSYLDYLLNVLVPCNHWVETSWISQRARSSRCYLNVVSMNACVNHPGTKWLYTFGL